MDNTIEPSVGNWYVDLGSGDSFQVVALDEDEDMIELQYFNGDIEEVSLTEWRGMDLEVASAPEDWSGPMDNVEVDGDYGSDRSNGDRRGLAQGRRATDLRSWDMSIPEDESQDWPPADEAGMQASGSRRNRRGTGPRSRRKSDGE